MGFSTSLFILPPQLKLHSPPPPPPPSCSTTSLLLAVRQRPPTRKSRSMVPVSRLFGPAIFEASKLKVLFVGVEEERHRAKLPRTYTLTHSDITSKLTLAVSSTIHQPQLEGWYNRFQRDEVVAEWKKVKGKMSLHVHCHISGGHFLLDLMAGLRFYIFSKELPLVLKAFVHGDESLFSNNPQLEEAPVWVYFHSNHPEFDRVECWGPLRDAASTNRAVTKTPSDSLENADANCKWVWPQRCQVECDCCFPTHSLIPWLHDDLPADKKQQPAAGETQQW